MHLFLDFYRNYILINDIILIYELVGVVSCLSTDFVALANVTFAIFLEINARNWILFPGRSMFTQQKRFQCLQKGANRILHDWVKVTKYHSRTFRFTLPTLTDSAVKYSGSSRSREFPAFSFGIKTAKMMTHSKGKVLKNVNKINKKRRLLNW